LILRVCNDIMTKTIRSLLGKYCTEQGVVK